MNSKRAREKSDEVPSKKRHLENNDSEQSASSTSSLAELPHSGTQLFKKPRNPKNFVDLTLKSGKIKQIHLKNFMCHSNFHVNLNKNVNVFVGLNGSGKSAILTALSIGLGSKASSTSRSTSIKDLVKRGETSATVEITLTNDGFDSFEAETYGKEITIVRTINSNSGASTYKLKSETGRIISTSRQDLSKLSLCLNIQVDNPVLILNQDAARSFLKDCDSKKLYQFFLKATQIDAIIEKLHTCLKSASLSKVHLENYNRLIKTEEEEVVVLKEKHEKLQSILRLRNDIERYRNEIEWSEVSDIEKKLKEAENQLESKREQIAEINNLVKNRAKIEKDLKEKIRDFGTEFVHLKEIVTSKDGITEQNRRECEELRDKLSTIQGSFNNLLERKRLVDENIAQLEADLAEREANPMNVENMRKQNEKRIVELSKEKEDLVLRNTTARRDYQQFNDTLLEYREKIDAANNQRTNIQSQFQTCTTQIRQMKSCSDDSLSAYGQRMPELIKKIEEMFKGKQFTELPRGPLGRYIEVPDKKYKEAVENILESTLRAFYVSCDKDRLVLTKLLQQYSEFSRYQIITGSFQKKVYDVRNGIVQLRSNVGRVLMDVIKVNDPVVINCLIDQKHIETIVLVDNTEIAIELTQEIENVPPNLSHVVLLNPFSDYYPAPNYRTYSNRLKPARYIQTNSNDVIAAIEHQKNELQEKIRHIQEISKQYEKKLREQEKLVTEKKTLSNELQEKIRQISKTLSELQAIEYPDENEAEYLRTELEELKVKKEAIINKINSQEEKVKELQGTVAQKEFDLNKSREEARETRENMTKIQSEIESIQQKLNEMSSDISLKKERLQVLMEEEKTADGTYQEFNASLSSALKNIKGKRVENPRPVNEINTRIRSAENRIRIIEENNDNIFDVELQLNHKVQQVDKMKQVITVHEQVLRKLDDIRTSRFNYVKRLRQHMSLRVKSKFNVLMNLRNYSAEAVIDHKEKTLELRVLPRDSQIAGAVSNTKSLSGGERSYSTVAFLISLWSCVDHPFYFLDEYDVFTDEYNRIMMTKLLFKEAEKKKNKQYGFLTPQDFSSIQASETITIHKLDDPDKTN